MSRQRRGVLHTSHKLQHHLAVVHSRIGVVRAALFIIFFAVICRLFYWQVLQSDRLQTIAQSQYETVQRISTSRGKIFSSDGYPLASNQDVYTVYVEPNKMSLSVSDLSRQLAPIIVSSLDDPSIASEEGKMQATQEWESTITQKVGGTKLNWIAIKRKLPREQKDQLAQLHIAGLGFDREEQRFYPEASVAAQLLGFVGSDQAGNEQGYFGVEGEYDRELRGKTGKVRLERDALGAPIVIGEYDEIAARDGRDVVLTIRRDLQYLLETHLAKGMAKYGSKTAEGIIMDPSTGAVLAMASLPSYDPGKYYQYDQQNYKNLLVSDLYEPGSTLKILTVAAGIDTGVITPETQCDACAGPRQISGYSIKTWNNKYTPNITITDALIHSDNTAMIFTQEKVGADRFIEYLKRFGLDRKTDIDVQEESSPTFRKTWKSIDVATSSFGQGIAVTGIQMIKVAQAIANKGMMMKPYIVAAVKHDDELITIEPKEEGRIISEQTAATVGKMMHEAAIKGEAKWAYPVGYSIAGKTGTAQVAIGGKYDETKTVTSFIGFAPVENPKFVMLIKLREPTTSQWGSETAAPLWFETARDVLLRFNVLPKE